MPPATLPHALFRAGSLGHAPVPRLTLDTAACAAVFERARATDLLILCFGIALGILFYAIAHDLSRRRWRDSVDTRAVRTERSRARTPRSTPIRDRSRSLVGEAPPPYAQGLAAKA